ncbi:MAG TPA: tautomerase family protein [Candidatus Faecicola pullistercoris]|nr:tautomerase family protein [Candidatus Faecicola pullistercoris]
MPHIAVKMLKGRTDEQKRKLADALAAAMQQTIGAAPTHITVSIEDYTPAEWQEQFRNEVTDRPQENIFIKPQYDPKDLL